MMPSGRIRTLNRKRYKNQADPHAALTTERSSSGIRRYLQQMPLTSVDGRQTSTQLSDRESRLIAPAARRISDPGRATPRAGRGHGPASRRAGLVRLATGTAPRFARWWRRCSWPRRHLHGTANRRDRGDERGPARSARQGRRRQQHSAAARQRVSAQSGRALTGSSLPRQVGRSRLRRKEEAAVIHLCAEEGGHRRMS